MWGFSFDDLARRAQEEAAKLAEQAQDAAASMQSPSLFNLDSMNPETSQNAPSTVQAPAASLFGKFSSDNSSNVNTAPPVYHSRAMQAEGNVDHVSTLVNDVASPRVSVVPLHNANTVDGGNKSMTGISKKKDKIAVTKLSTVSAAGTDDFFDSWGDDDTGAAADVNTTNVELNQDELQPVDNVAVGTLDVHDGTEKHQVVPEEEGEVNAWEDDFDPDHNEPIASENIPNEESNENAAHCRQEINLDRNDPSNVQEPDEEEDFEQDANAWGDDLDILDDNEVTPNESVHSKPQPEAVSDGCNDEIVIAEDNHVEQSDPVQSELPPDNIVDDISAEPNYQDQSEMHPESDSAGCNHVKQSDPVHLEPPPGAVDSNVNAWNDDHEDDIMDDISAEPNNHNNSHHLETESRESLKDSDAIDSNNDEHQVQIRTESSPAESDVVEPAQDNEVEVNCFDNALQKNTAVQDNSPNLAEFESSKALPDVLEIVPNDDLEPQKAAVEVIDEHNKDDEPVENIDEDVWADKFNMNIEEENKATNEQNDQDDGNQKEEGGRDEDALANRDELELIEPTRVELADPNSSSVQETARESTLSDNADEMVNNHLASEAIEKVVSTARQIHPSGSSDICVSESYANKKPAVSSTANDIDETDPAISASEEPTATLGSDSVDRDSSNDPWAEDDFDIVASESNETENINAISPAASHDLLATQPESVTPNSDLHVPNHVDGVEASSPDNFPSETENDPTGNEAQDQSLTQHDEANLADVQTEFSQRLDETQSIELPPHQAAPKSSIFEGAPDITAATQSLQSVFDTSNLFDTSKSSSMFGWSFQNAPAPNHDPEEKREETAVPEALSSVEETPANTPADAKAIDLYNDDALDDMYDDESDDEEEEQDENHPSASNSAIEKDGKEDQSDCQNPPEALPQHAVEKFVQQLERMTESHQLEMDELHRTYRNEIAQLQRELEDERTEKKKAKAREAVAAQDKHLSQMRELEKTFNKTLQQKEEELEQVMQRNEGFTLKMDSMKREVDGLLKLVDERDDEICRLKQGHGNTLLKVEDSIKGSQQELSRRETEIRDLKSSLASVQTELESTTEHYNTLKSRAKAVATELKDRRIEVRTLTSQNEELTTANASLETELTNLKSQNDQQQRTLGYKDKDIESLNEKIRALTKEMDSKDSLLQDKSSVGEKAISSYKRKAQEALAAANSRLAAANQAREEAESDAKAAKTASDDAVERARVAEAKRTEAERSASEAIELLEAERSAYLQAVADLQQAVDETRETIESMRAELEDAESSKESLHSEIDRMKSQLGEQREVNAELRQKLLEAKDLCSSLQEEVHDLRDEAQRSSAAAFKRQKDESSNESHKDDVKSGAKQRAESDGTIIMLQQELQGANDAIAELKLALRMALLEKAESSPTDRKAETTTAPMDQGHNHEASHGNDSTPLFFAIEKQNELNTARDEINRLANMLGDAESEKQEAFDAMEKMRQEMEQANARLQRYEKLGMKSTRPPNSSAVGYSSYRGVGHSNGTVSRENDSAVNLEYLKNVMLSYLNAKTLAERRKLVPVVATVLCLTPEEHSKAVQSVEESAGLTGVASSFWENLESKAHNLM